MQKLDLKITHRINKRRRAANRYSGLFLLGVGLAAANPAQATTVLKQVQIGSSSEVNLLFDGKVSKSQIRTEYFGDVIQLTLQDVSVYPAKISSINGSVLTKVFAYQYAPKLVRCRFSIRGKAEDFKGIIKVDTSGRVISVKLGTPVAQAKENPHDLTDSRQQALLKKVEEQVPVVASVASPPVEAISHPALAESNPAAESAPLILPKKASERIPLAGGKPMPSPFAAFGKLMLVMAIFGVCALALKKIVEKRSASSSNVMGAIGRFARNSLGKPAKMIEVVSTHYLGPKKSIAVVKVAGRVLVLGVTQESINLITEFDSETDFELPETAALVESKAASFESSAKASVFSDLLSAKSEKLPENHLKISSPPVEPAVTFRTPASVRAYQANSGAAPVSIPPGVITPAPQGGIRSQIKHSLEGRKPL